jgi:membrane-associated phospholipid phosphatase
MIAPRVSLILVLGALLTSACTTTTDRGHWGRGIDWPGGQRLGASALAAARNPHTWVPLAGAAVIGIAGWDDDISDWAVEKTPLFGNDAADVSDTLRTFNTGAWLATAILAPSNSLESRAKGLLVDGAALTIERYSVVGLKSLTDRERPNGSSNKSMPSGHTSRASAGAALAATNLDYIAMPAWARTTMQIGLYGTAAATGWARVEAEKHYPTDVLVGYAIGQFIARFMHEAFFNDQPAEASGVRFEPLPGGGAVTLVMPLR